MLCLSLPTETHIALSTQRQFLHRSLGKADGEKPKCDIGQQNALQSPEVPTWQSNFPLEVNNLPRVRMLVFSK
jgi:hypothetical protein